MSLIDHTSKVLSFGTAQFHWQYKKKASKKMEICVGSMMQISWEIFLNGGFFSVATLGLSAFE